VRVYSLIYPGCNAHAPYYIVIFGLSGSTTFPLITSVKTRLSEKKIIEQ